MKKTIFIGDIHGCFDEMMDLLAKCKYDKSNDELILLGDFINKGPKSLETINFILENNIRCILGNHEIGFLKGKIISLEKELKDKLKDYEKFIRFLNSLPYYIETDDYIAVHAGLIPGKHPKDSRPFEVASIRTWDGKGDDLQNINNPPWYDFYKGNKSILFGHWAAKGIVIKDHIIGLDSGCVYGRKLSAYIFEEKKLVQVSAQDTYIKI